MSSLKLLLLQVKNKTVCGTGHRPDKLGGYDNFVFNKLVTFAEIQLSLYQPKLVISGMALGWDQALAQASINLNIPFIAAIPFKNQEITWKKEDQIRWKTLIEQAKEIVTVSDGDYNPSKMQIRNKWMVDNSDFVFALWDGSSGGTKNCLTYASNKKHVINMWDDYQKFMKNE